MNTTLDAFRTNIILRGNLKLTKKGVVIIANSGDVIRFSNEEIVNKEDTESYTDYKLKNKIEIRFYK